VKGKI